MGKLYSSAVTAEGKFTTSSNTNWISVVNRAKKWKSDPEIKSFWQNGTQITVEWNNGDIRTMNYIPHENEVIDSINLN